MTSSVNHPQITQIPNQAVTLSYKETDEPYHSMLLPGSESV